MPDLSIEYRWWCRSNVYFQTEVIGSKGDKYTVTCDSRNYWECECKGFQIRKNCSHITKAEAKHCGWGNTLDEYDKPKGGKCPECGGEIEPVKVGV